MGTGYRPAANLPSNEGGKSRLSDGECDDERSLAEIVGGAFAEVDVDSVEAVREIRRDE